MLTSDLVRIRRKGDRIVITPLADKQLRELEPVAEGLIEATAGCVGRTRRSWERACAEVPVDARNRKIAAGLRKLVEDRCAFETDAGIEPAELRAKVFALASARRMGAGPGEAIDREAILAEAGEPLGLTGEQVDGRLFGDLKQARRLASFEAMTPAELLERYDSSQGQAVLLRASRVVAELQGTKPAALRRLFHKLKFLRLLHRIEALPGGGHRVEVDGPLALFGPSTKYGLQLALLLPALERAGAFSLDAEVLWGPKREPCTFHLEGGGGEPTGAGRDTTARDEVKTLRARLAKLDPGWTVRANRRVLDLPGVGLCVPDLVLTRDGARVYLEVMGYWSRDAVWKRVDLVEGGLTERILFCVSSRLRVSEAALGEQERGALYVYKGVLSAKQVLEKVEALAAREGGISAP